MSKPSLTPAAAAGQPPAAGPTTTRGRNASGQVRPADDRNLTDAELDARDAYLLEVTGPDAQQLVAKREILRAAADRLDDDRLSNVKGITKAAIGKDRNAALDALADKATEMPNAEYRDLVEAISAEAADQAKAEAVAAAEAKAVGFEVRP